MPVISITHTKGGVGKTTSSIFLATEAVRKGMDVCVLDADQQGSAKNWARKAAARMDPLQFDVLPHDPKLTIPRNDLVIIDTPPGVSGIVDLAIEKADLVVVPCGASMADVDRVWQTLKTIPTGKAYLLVLTSVDLRTSSYQKIRKGFDEMDHPVAEVMIPQREAIRRSFGKNPRIISAYGDLLSEIMEVLEYV